MKLDKYRGITENKLSNGNIAIYVRFKHLGKTYPVKNFTKLFGCRTRAQAFDKLQEVKIMLSKDIDPFNTQGETLNDYFYKSIEINERNGNWRDTTKKQYENFYEGYIKKDLGHRKLNKIKYADLEKVLDSLRHASASYRNRLYRVLSPIFDEAVKRDEIHVNPCKLLKYEKVDIRESIEKRVIEDYLTIAKILYKSFKEYRARYTHQRGELNAYFLLLLLTGHRQNETIELTRDDCYLEEGKIIALANITKTKEDYIFPIPDELREWISNKNKGEKLFPNMKIKSIYFQFRNILKTTEIKLVKDKTFSPHDFRRLMLNIMITECKIDSRLADYCLEHKQEGTIAHYLNYTFKDKEKAMKKYWKKIRD